MSQDNLEKTQDDTAQRLLRFIRLEAENKWGKKWVLELTRVYCEICRENGDLEANEHNRRRAISRVFEAESCTLATAITLAQCVDCQIQLARPKMEILVA